MDRPFPIRALLGFLAAALSLLIFEQGAAGLLHAAALPNLEIYRAPYDMSPRAPFGIPTVLVLCAREGVWGVVFGLASPLLSRPFWAPGLVLGLVISLVTIFVLPRLFYLPQVGQEASWMARILLSAMWGAGMGVIYALMAPIGTRGY